MHSTVHMASRQEKACDPKIKFVQRAFLSLKVMLSEVYFEYLLYSLFTHRQISVEGAAADAPVNNNSSNSSSTEVCVVDRRELWFSRLTLAWFEALTSRLNPSSCTWTPDVLSPSSIRFSKPDYLEWPWQSHELATSGSVKKDRHV